MSRSRNAYEAPSDAPVVNPFDRFSQGDFDDYVGGLRSKIRDALDPRRGLRNRDRDSDASFGLGYGEFRFGRSVSVGETSLAASGQSVPRSSVEGELGERRILYHDQGDDPESGVSDEEGDNQSPSKPTVVVSGAGDEESPFVISDEEDEEETPAPVSEVLTPRTKAHQLLGLQGYGDEEESEEEGSEEEEEDAITSSPLRAPLNAGPMNIYDDIDDVQLIEDSSEEGDAGENTANNAFTEAENTFEGSSPAWLAEPDAEEDVSEGGHAHDSTHSFDEYFVADLPPDLATSYPYNPSEPEMQEISGNTLNPFSQMLPPDLAAGASFFPIQESDTLNWQQGGFSNGGVTQQSANPAEAVSQASASHDDSRRISWPTLSGFGSGGSVSIFDAVGYAPHAVPPSSEPSFYFDVPEDVAPTAPQDATAVSRSTSAFEVSDEQWPTTQESIHPEAIGEPNEDTAPQLSEDVGSVATLSFTPPLSPSGVTLTAPEPSLLSDGSSVATSVPVALDPPLDAGQRIDSAEFTNNAEDLTLPEEVTQGLNRNVEQLPDPHQVPEPTFLGIPEGIAGLATRIVEPSVWAEPPTPFRSENADDAVSHLEADYSSDASETSTHPPQTEPVVEPLQVSRNPSRVRWEDHYQSDVPSLETPREELETLEQGLLQPTPLTEPSETPREELSLLERSLVVSTPIQTPVETPREELDTLAHRLVFPTPATEAPLEAPLETPRDDLQTLEQFLLTGGSTDDTPYSARGNLTRESTMTEATWSQGFPNSSPLRHATSATLTGESYFPSQPITSPGRQISHATQETLDASPSPDVDQSVARSVSPFSDGSPLSEDPQTPSTSMRRKRVKRASHLARVSSSVGTVGRRELKALQDVGTVLKGPRLRHSQSKPIIQTNTSPARGKGKQKSSPLSKKELPRIFTSTRVRALRSNSQASSAISKQRSPTSAVDHGDESDESSRDEIDLLERVDEERREREEDDMNGSEHSDLHPRNKRKRVPRISMPGDDEDYLPDDVERSLKKRKVEAKEHDLDHSLDAIDLASALEMAETTAVDARQAKKSKPKKKKKKQKQALSQEPVEAASSPEDSNDQASEFLPSPEDENAAESVNGAPELDAEAFDKLSPAAQTRFKRLDPDSRAYKPPGEDSESSDEEVTHAEVVADLETLVDEVDTSKQSDKGVASTQPTGTGPEAETKAKTKRAKKSGGGRKSKKEKAGLSIIGGSSDVNAVAGSHDVPSEEKQSRDVEMEVEEGEKHGGSAALLRGDDDDDDDEGSASATGQPLPSQVTAGVASSTSGWGNPFNWWRGSTPNVVPRSGGRDASPASDKMDTD